MWYDDAGVWTLKAMASPASTLMAVAKPWMLASPIPVTRQSLSGSPGRLFSQAITLWTGGPHGLGAAKPRVAGNTAATSASTPRTTRRAHRACDVGLSEERDTGPPWRVAEQAARRNCGSRRSRLGGVRGGRCRVEAPAVLGAASALLGGRQRVADEVVERPAVVGDLIAAVGALDAADLGQ